MKTAKVERLTGSTYDRIGLTIRVLYDFCKKKREGTFYRITNDFFLLMSNLDRKGINFCHEVRNC